jgi:hypothetical protein
MPVPNPYWASQAPVEEDSRGVRRGRRGVLAEGYWKGGMELFSATAFVCRIHISPSPHPKSMDQGLAPQASPWPGRKRRRALCGRLSGSGWRGQVGKAASFSDGLNHQNRPNTVEYPHHGTTGFCSPPQEASPVTQPPTHTIDLQAEASGLSLSAPPGG